MTRKRKTRSRADNLTPTTRRWVDRIVKAMHSSAVDLEAYEALLADFNQWAERHLSAKEHHRAIREIRREANTHFTATGRDPEAYCAEHDRPYVDNRSMDALLAIDTVTRRFYSPK